ncbi:MAG: glutathione S-transferase N-terminal domain-containing protein [Methylorubrum populi]
MRLFYAPRSPFSRKILATIAELGLEARVGLVRVDPWTDTALRRDNPACKVPTLLLDDGTALFDSPVIARYLDELAGHRLVPADAGRWDTLRREALGDALAEAVIRRFVERLGPEGERIARVVARQEAAIAAILDRLEAEPDWMRAPVDLGHLAIACALDYLDGRSPELGWDAGHGLLAAWLRDFRSRPSMTIAAAPESGAFRAA